MTYKDIYGLHIQLLQSYEKYNKDIREGRKTLNV